MLLQWALAVHHFFLTSQTTAPKSVQGIDTRFQFSAVFWKLPRMVYTASQHWNTPAQASLFSPFSVPLKHQTLFNEIPMWLKRKQQMFLKKSEAQETCSVQNWPRVASLLKLRHSMRKRKKEWRKCEQPWRVTSSLVQWSRSHREWQRRKCNDRSAHLDTWKKEGGATQRSKTAHRQAQLYHNTSHTETAVAKCPPCVHSLQAR